jgi:hypothetical protein
MNYSGLTTQERKKIYKKEETNLKKACTLLLKRYGGFSLPMPGGLGAVNGSPDRICFYAGRAVCIEFKREGQDLAPAQKEMRANILACACEYHLVRSEDDFIAAMGLPIRKLFTQIHVLD